MLTSKHSDFDSDAYGYCLPVQREARRAVQQAALEKQILDELRQSSEALRNIKDGYVAQASTREYDYGLTLVSVSATTVTE